MGQRLVHFPLIEKPFLRLEWPGMDDSNLFSVGAIDGENPYTAHGHSEIEEPRLD